LCRPKDFDHVKDIRPGDNIKSIWDEMNEQPTHFFYGEVEDIARQQDEIVRNIGNGGEPSHLDSAFPRSLFYNDADVLEDAILFPEELQQKTLDPSLVGAKSAVEAWAEKGFSLKEFTEGLDLVDSDLESEKSEWESDDEDKTHMQDGLDVVDSDEENDHDCDDESRPEITEQQGKDVLKEVLKGVPGDYLQQFMKAMAKPEDTRDRGDHDRISDEFMSYMDKEKDRSKSP
jgi:hypothetical protein